MLDKMDGRKDTKESATARICDANTLEGLQATDLECPDVNSALFERYLRYFQEIGFQPKPTALVGSVQAACAIRVAVARHPFWC